MKVLIEASEAYRNRGGIGRFSRELIRHLPADPSLQFSPLDYAYRSHSTSSRTVPQRLQHLVEHLWLTQVEGIVAAWKSVPDVYHSLSFFSPFLPTACPRVVTVFDLAYFDLPEQTDRFWGTYGRATMARFVRGSDAVVTTSDTMRERLIARFGLRADCVHLIYGGAAPIFETIPEPETLEAVRATYGVSRDEAAVLYVGAWHPNKNLPLLLRAFARLRDATLIITGQPHNSMESTLITLADELGVHVRFVGYVPDEDLVALYHLATIVVFPSRYEGFGLPVVEAMACGAAVIASDIPVLFEICGGAAAHFSVQSIDDLAETMRSLLASPAELARLKAKSRRRARDFSWQLSARQVVDCWRSVV